MKEATTRGAPLSSPWMQPCVAVALCTVATGCFDLGGLQSPRLPGDVTSLDDGSLAVDEKTDEVYLVRDGTLYVVDPEKGAARAIEKVPAGTLSSRIAFGKTRPFVARTMQVGAEASTWMWPVGDASRRASIPFGALSTPSSRDFIAIVGTKETVILDGTSLEPASMPATYTELAWMGEGDRFVTLSCGTKGIRVETWQAQAVSGAAPSVDRLGQAEIENELCAASSWLAVAPNASFAVFPVGGADASTTAEPRLLAVELGMGLPPRSISGIKGPVAFSQDGTKVIGFRDGSIRAFDWKANTTMVVDAPPFRGDISYYRHPERDRLLVGNASGLAQRLMLVDLPSAKAERLGPPGVGLTNFVASGPDELWLVDHEALFHLDLAKPALELVATEAAPHHIQYLPNRKRVVIDDANAQTVSFLDPATRSVVMVATLGGDGSATPAAE
ncbi:MAG: hypothetical protein HOW73_15315 [Polyangiaceae bacterium]|nr:hypothetical protein [Polyangiaceae bacterium]